MKSLSSFCYHTINIIYIILSFVILSICLLLNHLNYAYKKIFLLPNIILLPIGLFLVFLGFFALKKIRACIHPLFHIDKLISIFSILFFISLCILSSQYYFKTGWDVKYVLDNSELISSGNFSQLCHWYFSRYPNNILISYVFALVIRACNLLHIENYYLVLIFIQCIIYAYVGFILYHCVCLLLNNRLYALSAYVLYIALVGLSPWVVIPYSDSIGLFFVLTIFYLYLKYDRTKKIFLVFCIAFLTYIGFKIKPQAAIITIAILIVSFCRFFCEKYTCKRLIPLLLISFTGILSAFILVQMSVYFSHFEINEEAAFSPTHYIMMGLNEESNGGYYQPDVDFSASFSTRKERTSANLSVISSRLSSFTPDTLFPFYAQKILSIYNDGSFAWNGEGYFFLEYHQGGLISKVLTHTYYPEGRLYPYYLIFLQALWMSVLFLSCFARARNCDAKTFQISTLKLSLIGLFFFELLFEARARYLFIYTPVFILAAVLGLHTIVSKCNTTESLPN